MRFSKVDSHVRNLQQQATIRKAATLEPRCPGALSRLIITQQRTWTQPRDSDCKRTIPLIQNNLVFKKWEIGSAPRNGVDRTVFEPA
jgi:hypothetical protein